MEYKTKKSSKLEKILKKVAFSAACFGIGAVFGAVMPSLMREAGLKPVSYIESPPTTVGLSLLTAAGITYFGKAKLGEALLTSFSTYAGVATGEVAARYLLGK